MRSPLDEKKSLLRARAILAHGWTINELARELMIMPHQLWHHVKTGKPGLGLFQLQINRIYRQAQREPAFTPEPIVARMGWEPPSKEGSKRAA